MLALIGLAVALCGATAVAVSLRDVMRAPGIRSTLPPPGSKPGRLEVRLRRAMLPPSAMRWRCIVWGGTACASVTAIAMGASPVMALSVIPGLIRTCVGMYLRCCASRCATAATRAAPRLARHLATGLSLGQSTATSIGPLGATDRPGRLLDDLLAMARTCVALGETAGEAIAAAVGALSVIDSRAAAAFRPVAAIAIVGHRSNTAAATALGHLADALDADAVSRREAASQATEARFVATALPVVTATAAIIITTLSPAALIPVFTPLGFTIVAIACAAIVAGVTTVLAGTRA